MTWGNRASELWPRRFSTLPAFFFFSLFASRADIQHLSVDKEYAREIFDEFIEYEAVKLWPPCPRKNWKGQKSEHLDVRRQGITLRGHSQPARWYDIHQEAHWTAVGFCSGRVLNRESGNLNSEQFDDQTLFRKIWEERRLKKKKDSPRPWRIHLHSSYSDPIGCRPLALSAETRSLDFCCPLQCYHPGSHL